MPTISVENYLKAIYHIEARDGRVKTKALADALELSLPSVSVMVQTLASSGLVDHEPYRGVVLTEEGRRAALAVIRKHRLVEMFLVETLGFSWDEVHAEAELLEHSVSDKLEERIATFLGNPRFDPHGDPIPTVDGEIEHHDAVLLADTTPPQEVTLVRVLDQSPDVLKHLTAVGLVPQTTFRVVDVLSFDGQMTVVIPSPEETTITISRTLASRLLVT